MKQPQVNHERLLTISQYARLLNVNRRTVYNWIERKEKGIELVGEKGKRFIKVPPTELQNSNLSLIDINEEAIKDLSVSDLASLCTMYKLSPSHDSFTKLTAITSELDKRLTNIFI